MNFEVICFSGPLSHTLYLSHTRAPAREYTVGQRGVHSWEMVGISAISCLWRNTRAHTNSLSHTHKNHAAMKTVQVYSYAEQ